MSRPTLRERFGSRAIHRPSGCIEWSGKMYPNGYGALMHLRKWRLAHRVAWELERGAIPLGLSVLHRCDNRACVNVEHLFLGTQADNIHDAKNKGRLRGVRGAANYRAKLTDADVRDIRERAGRGVLQRVLADDYGVSPKQISVIVSGKQWSSA